MRAAKNFYVSSLAGFAQLHSHKELGHDKEPASPLPCLSASQAAASMEHGEEKKPAPEMPEGPAPSWGCRHTAETSH